MMSFNMITPDNLIQWFKDNGATPITNRGGGAKYLLVGGGLIKTNDRDLYHSYKIAGHYTKRGDTDSDYKYEIYRDAIMVRISSHHPSNPRSWKADVFYTFDEAESITDALQSGQTKQELKEEKELV